VADCRLSLVRSLDVFVEVGTWTSFDNGFANLFSCGYYSDLYVSSQAYMDTVSDCLRQYRQCNVIGNP
jgi:hypothetical protein